ncbi:FG-GAP-like repeat-containing protein, partial [Micromonospora sp. LOL_023]|uniref:FG-GAP-like repeat-containing protein n=1 Tax=Micromonospora sp. LOL_023 TaxID=3345418 RepID=UPI003A8C131D
LASCPVLNTDRTSQAGTTPGPWVRTVASQNPVPQVVGLGSVAGSREAVVGTAVCRSGVTTGVRCGKITAKNRTVSYLEGTVYGMTATDACSEKGDSGGPFMAGDQAQGIASGGMGACGDSAAYTFYQPINAALSAYGLTLLTVPSTPWWDQSPGNSDRGTLHMNVNGDGLDDVVAFYDYGNSETRLWVFIANNSGGLNPPTVAWYSGGPGTWDLTRTRLVGGDFNGDGRDDIGAFYDYGNNETRLWAFTANNSGSFNNPTMQYNSGPGNWNLGGTALV